MAPASATSLIALAVEKGIAADKKRTRPLLNKCREGVVDFRPRAGIQHPDLPSQGARRCLLRPSFPAQHRD